MFYCPILAKQSAVIGSLNMLVTINSVRIPDEPPSSQPLPIALTHTLQPISATNCICIWMLINWDIDRSCFALLVSTYFFRNVSYCHNVINLCLPCTMSHVVTFYTDCKYCETCHLRPLYSTAKFSLKSQVVLIEGGNHRK